MKEYITRNVNCIGGNELSFAKDEKKKVLDFESSPIKEAFRNTQKRTISRVQHTVLLQGVREMRHYQAGLLPQISLERCY